MLTIFFFATEWQKWIEVILLDYKTRSCHGQCISQESVADACSDVLHVLREEQGSSLLLYGVSNILISALNQNFPVQTVATYEKERNVIGMSLVFLRDG